MRLALALALVCVACTPSVDASTYGARAPRRAGEDSLELADVGTTPNSPSATSSSSVVGRELRAFTWGIGGDRVGRPSRSSALPPGPIELDSGLGNVVAVAASGHTAFVLEDGSLYTAGRNASDGGGGRGSPPIPDAGQIGRDGPTGAPGRVLGALRDERVTSVACGRYHTVASTESGRVYSFGLNDRGQLGAKGVMGHVPKSSACKCDSGNDCECSQGATSSTEAAPGETCERGAACRSGVPVRVDLGDAKIKSVAAGRYTSAAVSEKGEVFVWGLNACGGDRNLRDELLTNSRASSAPRKIDGVNDVVKVDIGYIGMIFLTSKGEVYTCYTGFDGYAGANADGTANTALKRHAVFSSGTGASDVATGRCHFIVSTTAGKVYTWGCPNALGRTYGEHHEPTSLSVEMSREFVVAVAAGEYFSLMLTREGEIHGMGDSNSGQLGVQNPGSRFKTPTRIASIPARALAVAAGYQHAAAVLA